MSTMKIIRAVSLAIAFLIPVAAIASPTVREGSCCPYCEEHCPMCPGHHA